MQSSLHGWSIYDKAKNEWEDESKKRRHIFLELYFLAFREKQKKW